MAIDTRNKRASCIGLLSPNRLRTWPNPDGSLANQADRQHMAYTYAAVLTAAGGTPYGITTQMCLTGVGN